MPAEIGIMFVHGIGSQTRGETLVNFGEPFYKKLKDWIELVDPNEEVIFNRASNEHGAKVQLIDAFLSPLTNEPSQQAEPAHVRLRIATDFDCPAVEWVLAECHWATSFPPPPPKKVTLWIMRVLPWICFTFIVRRLRMVINALVSAMTKSPRRWLEVAWLSAGLLLVLLALPFISPTILLLELCLVTLLIVQLVPLKVVQDLVTRINAAISAVLGDSYIFASSEFRQQAVTMKLSRDLMWLKSKFDCKNVVVIAHSQGAAIAYLTLKNFGLRLSIAKLLITFGAGILKLYQLESRDLRTLIDMVGLGFVMATGTTTLLSLAEWGFAKGSFLLWWYAGTALLLLIVVVLFTWEEHAEEIKIQASKFAERGLKWIDLYASWDPVPNGPLFLAPADVESVQLCNQSSLIADHTSYAGNQEEFLLSMVDAVARHSGTTLKISHLLEPARMLAKGIRRIKISSAQIDKTILLVALVAVLLNREAIDVAGRWLSDWIDAGCQMLGVGNCHYSPWAIGLGIALAVFVLLRMSVQYQHFMGESLWWTDNEKNFQPFLNASFASHAIACLALSFVSLLYYAQTFAPIEWLFRRVPDFYWSFFPLGLRPAVWLFQAYILGMVVAFLLQRLDKFRVSRLLIRWQHAKEVHAKSHTVAA